MELSLEDIMTDLHELDRELAGFESKYRMLSEDFFALYEQGLVDDSLDIHEWAGLYKAKPNLKEMLRNRLGGATAQVQHLRQRQDELTTA